MPWSNGFGVASACRRGYAGRMTHGHERSDRRNLELHRAAFAKLERQPGLRNECLALVDQWIGDPDHRPAQRWLRQWREMLAEWPLERIKETVLSPTDGQTLRQCSPLAPVLTPRERWKVLEVIDTATQSTRDLSHS
jgi:hypothetical protein